MATISSQPDLAEARRRCHPDQLEALARLGRLALESEHLPQLIGHVATVVSQTLRVGHVGLFHLLPDEKSLRLLGGCGWSDAALAQGMMTVAEESQVGTTIQSREPVIVPEIRREAYFQPPQLLLDEQMTSSAMALIESSDRPLGVLGAFDASPKTYSTQDRVFLKAVAEILSPAMQRLQQEQINQFHVDAMELAVLRTNMRLALTDVCKRVEELVPTSQCVVLLFEEKTHHLRVGAAPSVAPELLAAIDGLQPGRSGEVETIAQRFGTRACWSTPIFLDPGRVVGTFAILLRCDAKPTSNELQILDLASRASALCVRMDRERHLRRRAEASATVLQNQMAQFLRERDLAVNQLQQESGERKRVEDLVRGGEERYRDLFENATDLIQIISPDGGIRFVNRAWRQALGYADTEVRRLSLFEVIHPDSRSQWHLLLRKANTGQQGERMECKFTTRDGKTIVAEGAVSGFYENGRLTSVRGIFRDVTERKRAEEEQQKFVSLVESSTDFIAMASLDGQLIFMNETGRHLVGLDPSRPVASLHLSDLHAFDTWSTLQRIALPAINETLRWEGEGKLRHLGNGSLRDVHISLFLVRNPQNNEPLCIATVQRDITQRKEVDRMKDELVATVSHELRTPLTSLRGYTELLLAREFTAEKQRQFLQIVYDETIRLNKLINDFLDIRRMESGRQTYEFVSLDLVPVVQEAMKLFRHGTKKLTWDIQLPQTLPPVYADRDRMFQVLANLVGNAVKFTSDGGKIIVGARQQGAAVLLWVTDTGPGIAKEEQAQLFTKFYRGSHSTKNNLQGSGLGLSIVKEIIDAHEGRVAVDSAVGKGSTFSFSLPALTTSTSNAAV
ncbi:MAG: PAS domain S-box protein [Phycisphaeraceae bacterium]|nr:PAS domain S-box protein [Phycisphaeraceae bacterium]